MIWKAISLLGLALCAQGHKHATSEQMIKQEFNLEHHGHHGELHHIGSHKPEHHGEYAWAYPSYEFSYHVSDPHTHDFKGQHESRHGDEVQGEYWLVQPDGKKRTVKYHSDKHNGFKAHVHYEDHHHQEEPHKEEIIKPVVEIEEEPPRPIEEPILLEEGPETIAQEEGQEEREENREEEREEEQEEKHIKRKHHGPIHIEYYIQHKHHKNHGEHGGHHETKEEGQEENRKEEPHKHLKHEEPQKHHSVQPVHIEHKIHHPVHHEHFSHDKPHYEEPHRPVHIVIPVVRHEKLEEHRENKNHDKHERPIYKPLLHHDYKKHHKSEHHHIPSPILHHPKFGARIQHHEHHDEHRHSEDVNPIQVDEVRAERKHHIEHPPHIPLLHLHRPVVIHREHYDQHDYHRRYHRDHRQQKIASKITKH